MLGPHHGVVQAVFLDGALGADALSLDAPTLGALLREPQAWIEVEALRVVSPSVVVIAVHRTIP
jgi:hypothetical protein